MNLINIAAKLEEIVKQVSQITGISDLDLKSFETGVSEKAQKYFIEQLTPITFTSLDEKSLGNLIKNAYAVSVKNVCTDMLSSLEGLGISESKSTMTNISQFIAELDSIIK